MVTGERLRIFLGSGHRSEPHHRFYPNWWGSLRSTYPTSWERDWTPLKAAGCCPLPVNFCQSPEMRMMVQPPGMS
jgi:hypothetical protein